MMKKGETVPEATRLLSDAGDCPRDALDQQVPLLYDQLKRIAELQLRTERAGHTLNPTALVHEAYLKLADQTQAEMQNHGQILALTARMMRRVLVDHARRRMAGKRGRGWSRTTLSGQVSPTETYSEELLALDEALGQLQPRQRQVVELRFFTGLTEAEIGEVLDVSERTVRREWVKARAWLYSELYPDG
jgi:RNA polymerase sigma factor (TIGR02999 family)